MTSQVELQPYDFRKPGGLTDQVAQRLELWQRAVSSLTPERWSQHMNQPVTLEPEPYDTQLMIDARRSLPEPAAGCVISLGGEEAPSLLVIGRPLQLALVGLVLGEVTESLPDDRPLTTIERSISDLLFEELASALAESWPDQQPLDCRVRDYEDKPQRSRLFPLGERVLTSRFQVKGPFGGAEMYWLAAQETMSRMLGSIAEIDALAAEAEMARQPLEQQTRDVPVRLIVRLGDAELHVADLANLQVGDVLVLDQKINEPLQAEVEGQVKFHGWPGRVGTRQAFQIEELI